MAVTRETHELVISGYGENTTHGHAQIEQYDRTSRWGRALGGLSVAWLVAGVTIFIPVAHFLLVPGFFLFGIYVFARRFNISSIATELKGSCPDCSLDQSFDPGDRWFLPRSVSCAGCRRTLKMRTLQT